MVIHLDFRSVALLVLFLLLLPGAVFAAAGPQVLVTLQAPTGSLASLEGPPQTLFNHDATIPYGAIEPAIRTEAKAKANQYGDHSGTRSWSYIDYAYKTNASAGFEFSQKNQPTITVLSSTENKVRVALHTEAVLTFEATASATTDDHLPIPPFTEWPDFDGSIEIEVPFALDVQADLAIWPEVVAENVSVVLTNGDLEGAVTGLKGDMAGFALVVGTTIGFSPAGLVAGGPATMGVAAVLGSNEAYDLAVTKMVELITTALEKGVATANAEIRARIQDELVPAVAAVNHLKNQAIATPIPGIGKSLGDLQNEAGLSFDVRTQSSGNGGTHTAVTARFDGKPRGGKVEGTLRLPKAQCVKTDVGGMGQTIVTGFLGEANQDLHAGQSCAGLFGANDMKLRVFLGANPPGAGLASWADAPGQFVGKGTVRERSLVQQIAINEGYFECDFEVNGLPKGVVSFSISFGQLANRLEDYKLNDERRWVLGAGQGEWTLGGSGKCEGIGKGGGLTPNRQEEIRRALENCPECKRPGEADPREGLIRPDLPSRRTPEARPDAKQRPDSTDPRGYGGPDTRDGMRRPSGPPDAADPKDLQEDALDGLKGAPRR
ncbi:MAG: hypothetical protein GY723_11250 [bacterium]|nr:hypothetical protein [bacterium]MCP5067324.1 hypothetical protein [bacterium]